MTKKILNVILYVALFIIIIVLSSYAIYYREIAVTKDAILTDYQYLVNKVYEVDCNYSDLPIDITDAINKEGSILVYKSRNMLNDYYGIALTVVNDKIIKVELHKP